MKRYGLLLSGGMGTRLGAGIPKQYLPVNGRMLLLYSLGTLLKSEDIDGVWVVAAPEWRDKTIRAMREEGLPLVKFGGFARAGVSRQRSILNGMEKILQHTGLPQETDQILIHDAARPGLSGKMVHVAFRIAEEHDGAMPVLPMKDTVYLSDPGKKRAAERLNRDLVFAGQAPEVFRMKRYYEVCSALSGKELDAVRGSAEPAIAAGMDIAIFPGEETNFKITTEEDLVRFQEMCGRQKVKKNG